jgi:hypothetical protein
MSKILIGDHMSVEPKKITTLVELREFFKENFPEYVVMKSKYDEIVIRTGQTTAIGQDLITWKPECYCGGPFDENAMVLDLPSCSKCMACKVCNEVICKCNMSNIDDSPFKPQLYPWDVK